MRHRTHYEALFRQLERAHGRLDAETLTAVVGFGGGGPVSLSKIERANIYVTCELSLYPQQKRSAEGLKFELLSLGAFPGMTCRGLFTALGNLSMEAALGHDHTIDVRQVLSAGAPSAVRLELFSECEIDGERFGVYQVLPANDEAR